MSVGDRHNLWKNAKAKDTPEGRSLVSAIEALGLPFSETGGLKMDDPLTLRMWSIIHSAEGKAACFAATTQGFPAVAGVDPMLREALGVDYGSHNQSTNTAGAIVAEVMRTAGYVQAAEGKPLPAGSVAKTGWFWKVRGA